MPRPGPRRPILAVRADQLLIDDLDALAAERGLERSEYVRRVLTAHVKRAAGRQRR